MDSSTPNRMLRHACIRAGLVDDRATAGELDDGPAMQAINAGRRVVSERAKHLGPYAPTRRAVDVITHDALMDAVADLEADIARQEAELASHESRDVNVDA